MRTLPTASALARTSCLRCIDCSKSTAEHLKMTAAAAAKEGATIHNTSPARNEGHHHLENDEAKELAEDMTFLCDAFRVNRGVRLALWEFDARTLEDFSLMTNDDFREMIVDALRVGRQIPPLQQRKLSVLLEWTRRLAEEHQERQVERDDERRRDGGEEREQGSSSRRSCGDGTGPGTATGPRESGKATDGRNSSVYFDAIAISDDDQSGERGGDRCDDFTLLRGDEKTVTFDDVSGSRNGTTKDAVVNNNKSTAASLNYLLRNGTDAAAASTIPPDWRERFLSDLPTLKRRLREVGETSEWSLYTGTYVNMRWLFCGVA